MLVSVAPVVDVVPEVDVADLALFLSVSRHFGDGDVVNNGPHRGHGRPPRHPRRSRSETLLTAPAKRTSAGPVEAMFTALLYLPQAGRVPAAPGHWQGQPWRRPASPQSKMGITFSWKIYV